MDKGISVVLATANGSERIIETLESVAQQTIHPNLFELIIVVNGTNQALYDPVLRWAANNLKCKTRWFYSHAHGVGAARNIGISASRREFITFLDDDDILQSEFLAQAMTTISTSVKSDLQVFVLSPIVDIEPNGVRSEEGRLSLRIQEIAGQHRYLNEVPWVVGFNACKIVPRRLFNCIRYPEHLDSGEDVAFFSQLLAFPDLKVLTIGYDGNNAYQRVKRMNSVSRKSLSFDFNVRQRVDVVYELSKIYAVGKSRDALEAQMQSQYNFIIRFVNELPSEKNKVIDWLLERRPPSFPWQKLIETVPSKLVMAYCFAPYSDTSANVVAKIIDADESRVDVISANMATVRSMDISVERLISPWVRTHVEIDVKPAFSNWRGITDFSRKAFSAAEQMRRCGNKYEELYSRSMWAGSHVAAVLQKLAHPEIKWTAEFSDPLRRGVDGRRRISPLENNRLSKRLTRLLYTDSAWKDLEILSTFDLVEFITLKWADEVVFTNENQLDYVLSEYPKNLATLIRKKSVVRAHPVPKRYAYQASSVKYPLSSYVINIGYFGNFYTNRGLDLVLLGLKQYEELYGQKIALHVFTRVENESMSTSSDVLKMENLYINESLSYLDFLNLSTHMDVLLVTDIETGQFPLNPFLPSKLSDYLGSGSKIWAIQNETSLMKNFDIEYRSEVGNQESVLNALLKISEEN